MDNRSTHALAGCALVFLLMGCGGGNPSPLAPLEDDADPISAEVGGITDVDIASNADVSSGDLIWLSNSVEGDGQFHAGESIAVNLEVASRLVNPNELENLSVALEYSSAADFATVSRSAVSDLQMGESADGNLTIAGQTTVAGLPSGGYFARLVVNPDWKLHFEHLPVNGDLLATARYLIEPDYSNNHGDTFMLDVVSDVSCSEDAFEPSNSFGQAMQLTIDSSVDASLCLDDVDLYSFEAQAGGSYSFDIDLASGDSASTKYWFISPGYLQIGVAKYINSQSSVTFVADYTGRYYLALFGDRTDYQISITLAADAGS